MDTLIRRKGILKGQITKLHTFAKNCTDQVAYDDIKDRVDKLNEHYRDFIEVEDKIFSIDSTVKSDMDLVDDAYYTTLSLLKKFMRTKINAPVNSLNDTLNTSNTGNLVADFKLPRLTLPTFNGNAREWQSFYDLFKSTVHENTTLTPAQKFQYLKGLLKGPAEQLLRHFRVDDANYIEAFQRLVNRYDKKRHIVNEFIEFYLNQPKVTIASSESISRMYDTCDEVIRGLKSLGKTAESRDCWLIYIVENKLDDVTRQLWRQETSEVDFPTYDDFLKFLSKRMDSLEGLKCQAASNSSKSQSKSTSSNSAKSFHNQSTIPTCTLCTPAEHRLSDCPKFLAMTIDKRRDYIKDQRRCFNCLGATHQVYQCKLRKHCSVCLKKHNTLVHKDFANVPTPSSSHSSQASSSSSSGTCMYTMPTNHVVKSSECDAALNQNELHTDAILPTALVEVKNQHGDWQVCRALLDSASTRSFVTESCVNRLGLTRVNARINIDTLNGGNAQSSRGATSLRMRSRFDHDFIIDLHAFILPKITSNLPAKMVNLSKLKYLSHLKMADPKFYVPSRVDILIGCDKFLMLLCDGQVIESENTPTAQNTKLGWIIGGTYDSSSDSTDYESSTFMTLSNEINIDKTLRQFWEIEELPNITPYSESERLCVEHFERTHQRDSDGKFIVSLPFKSDAPALGESLTQALKRFESLERKFLTNPNFKSLYLQFLAEYEALGHMERVPEDEIDNHEVYYMPHHGVLKSSSSTTKLRVVFDASAKTKSGLSLNDALLIGPTIQQSLFEILLRFRKHRYIFSGDAEKMYRQVWVEKSHQDFQRIVWRESQDVPVRHYRLRTVTYGTCPASFLATKTLEILANDHAEQYPKASKIIKTDFYMDDLMSGAESLEEAKRLQGDIASILESGGFHLRKWSSNHPELLSQIPIDDQEISPKDITEGTKLISVLGIRYNPLKDCFTFRVDLPPISRATTKKIFLSEASRIFDPLGWLSPAIVKIKVLFQGLWTLKTEWDEVLPNEVLAQWILIREQLEKLQNIEIPRWLFSSTKLELIGFADASQDAYAAVIYARVVTEDKKVLTYLVAAKTKVAPLKSLTIPKLELSAALILSNLLQLVLQSLDLGYQPTVQLFTDSTTVLDWLSSPPQRGNIFVTNRTGQILAVTDRSQWRHVPTDQNPADCASRGLTPTELIDYKCWWRGPKWIRKNPIVLPERLKVRTKKEKVLLVAATEKKDAVDDHVIKIIITKFNGFFKAKRILAVVLRFIHNLKNRNNRKRGFISLLEIEAAQNELVKFAQTDEFNSEIKLLTRNCQIDKNSKLRSLNPVLDPNGLLRVGGRLERSTESFDFKHPIIMPNHHAITEMIVHETHQDHFHAGPALLVTVLKQQFAIFRCKDVARRIIKMCVTCVRHKGETLTQQMGQLPTSRVNLVRAFSRVSVDFAGPYLLKTERKRKATTYKAYLAIFSYMATRAIHLELVTGLTSEAFLAALKRFQGRRGIASDIFSDNGTNFAGASNELKAMWKLLSDQYTAEQIVQWTAKKGTTWHFIPPATPHFNGLCEAAVKSTKFHLRRVLGDTLCTYEELSTLLCQIEATLNSRPICWTAEDEFNPLTIGHFIIGQSLTIPPEPDLTSIKQSRLTRWKQLHQMYQHFWKRWHDEYLTSLNRLSKWQRKSLDVKIGDVVLLRDENLPAGQWALGRVEILHPGSDSHVRVVTVKTEKGFSKRPITKLCLLPCNFDPIESTPAECREIRDQSDSIITVSSSSPDKDSTSSSSDESP